MQLILGVALVGAIAYVSYNYIKKNPQSKLALGTGIGEGGEEPASSFRGRRRRRRVFGRGGTGIGHKVWCHAHQVGSGFIVPCDHPDSTGVELE